MTIEELLKNPHNINEALRNTPLDYFSKDDIEKLLPYISDPFLLFRIAFHFHIKLPKEQENLLLETDYELASQYALHIKKERWLELEKEIRKHSEISVDYARVILKDRFVQAESIILKNPLQTTRYIDFLKSIGKFDEFKKEYPYLNY